ncbi:hypothetical protein GCM10009785_07750 [Brooklawnia cerclae]|uniref:Lipoprotein n=1 Tax=Brooklawnia cerclae TaxID=349934 RepID=A0ABX0SIX5_9ACTN|nr:hypothetical protein [Brooklawnia cerclae]NIH58354.1 hypothetical protein [Brooklawnia cerclae]
MRRRGTLAAAMALVLAGCTAPVTPLLDQAAALLDEAIAEHGRPVAAIVVRSSELQLNLRSDDGGVTLVTLLPERSETTTASQPVAARPSAEFPVAETVSRASALDDVCEGSWQLDVSTASEAALLSRSACDGNPTSTQLNDTALPALAAEWDDATLTTLWSELELLAPEMSVLSVQLGPEQAYVLLAADATTPEGWAPAWSRSLASPSDSAVVLRQAADGGTPIDLTAVTPQTVAGLVTAGQRAAGIAEADGLSVYIADTGEGPAVTVSKGAQTATLPVGG